MKRKCSCCTVVPFKCYSVNTYINTGHSIGIHLCRCKTDCITSPKLFLYFFIPYCGFPGLCIHKESDNELLVNQDKHFKTQKFFHMTYPHTIQFCRRLLKQKVTILYIRMQCHKKMVSSFELSIRVVPSHTINAYLGVKVYLHSFLTLALVGLTSHPCAQVLCLKGKSL